MSQIPINIQQAWNRKNKEAMKMDFQAFLKTFPSKKEAYESESYIDAKNEFRKGYQENKDAIDEWKKTFPKKKKERKLVSQLCVFVASINLLLHNWTVFQPDATEIAYVQVCLAMGIFILALK